MKVIFNRLDKTTLVVSAFRALSNDYDNSTPLTEEQISSIKDLDEIGTINGVPLNLKFKGNYVEFDDKVAGVYTNLLYKMKTRNAYFDAVISEDPVNKVIYKVYIKKISDIEKGIDKLRDALLLKLEKAVKIKKELETCSISSLDLSIEFKILKDSVDEITSNIRILTNLRFDEILKVFKLEGDISEEKIDDDDDLVIIEL